MLLTDLVLIKQQIKRKNNIRGRKGKRREKGFNNILSLGLRMRYKYSDFSHAQSHYQQTYKSHVKEKINLT